MADNSSLSCPPPFLDLSHFPKTGGYTDGRFCGQITDTLSCCLPCPLVEWVYSDSLFRKADIATWFNVPALVCQVFLLLTFTVLPQEKVHGRYLSIGLCVALVMLELAFIIPLGTAPKQCYNDITPNDMYSSLSCAWSGALLEAGSMSACVWILLRSLYTHLRVCWDVELTKRFTWIAHGVGWGLPALFLAISLPITGLSYKLVYTCSPNPHRSFVTWFGWLLALALLGATIQFATTIFCLVIYARSFFGRQSPNTTGTGTSTSNSLQKSPSQLKRLAWRRVHKVLVLQWRSIVLSFIVIAEAVYSGLIYIVMTRTQEKLQQPQHANNVLAWTDCLIDNTGDKTDCLKLAKPIRLGEGRVVASLYMASLMGMLTFLLMVRWSMLVGWWELIRHPLRRRKDSEDFIMCSPAKHMSLAKPLASESNPKDLEKTEEVPRQMSIPEPGDVSQRHPTTTLFDVDIDDEDDEKEARRIEQDDVV